MSFKPLTALRVQKRDGQRTNRPKSEAFLGGLRRQLNWGKTWGVPTKRLNLVGTKEFGQISGIKSVGLQTKGDHFKGCRRNLDLRYWEATGYR